MQYFKLHIFCKFINGKDSGCIYNMKTHEMISVPKALSEVLEKAQTNKPLSENEGKILEELVEKDLGGFYDNPNYIESFQYGPNPAIKTMITPNTYVRRCYIQLTNDCDLNCSFCNNGNNVNRRTGCKKWNNSDAGISLEEWDGVMKQLKKLGCEEICFIGGNPFLAFEKLSQVVEMAAKQGIGNFCVYSHNIEVSDAVLEFMQKYRFQFVGTIISFQNTTYEQVTGSGKEPIKIFEHIRRLVEKQIGFVGNIVVGKFNEDEVEIISNEFSRRGIPYKYNIIYDKPWNEFFSERYVNMMYEKNMDFGFVTKESISFLGEYNSCIYGQLYVNISGDITPCPMMNAYTVGNIRNTGGIAAAVNSEKYQRLVQMSRNKVEACKHCAYRLNCFDCRAIEYMATDKIDGQEYCKYSKEGEEVG